MRPNQAKPLMQRLLENSNLIETEKGCIEWAKACDKDGYGRIRVGSRSDGSRKSMRVHVLAWILENGDVPDGLFVCHICDNPPCWEISHLFLGTAEDNMRDMSNKGRGRGQSQTECIYRHEYTPKNTLIKPNGTRSCRRCANERCNKGIGSGICNRKLTADQVREIRSLYGLITQKELAEKYGVTSRVIKMAAIGQSYREVA